MADTFLLYRPDPFGVSMSRYALAQGDNLKFLSGGELYLHPNQVITFDVPTLIEDLRRNGHPPPKAMIDACDAIRLATGLSKSDGGEPKWDYWRWLRPYFAADSHWAALKAMHSSRTSDAPHLDDETLFNSFAEASRALWHDLLEKLLSLGEHERFFRVEVPAANVFHARQFKGIAIDTDYVDDALRRASQSKYDAYREVAKQINISPSGLNYWNVSRHLPLSERTFLDEAVQGYSLRDQLKMASDTSAFARAFTELMDASKDVDILTRLSGSNRTFPTFHCIGTISCRTLVSDPHLQELRRRFRGAIVSDNGNSLHYFDYSQFEPGIMASLSGDPELISMYNQGDIYSELSRALFGSNNQRDLCKKVFLAFSYGMSAAGISRLLKGDGSASEERAAIEQNVKGFFSRFKTLTQFKGQLELRLLREGKISTPLGNNRHRRSEGPLTHKERRWAVSQRVQGTASLIFKCAVIELARSISQDAVVLPMHDAVVVQLPADDTCHKLEARVREAMCDSFRAWCPRIEPRVMQGRFA